MLLDTHVIFICKLRSLDTSQIKSSIVVRIVVSQQERTYYEGSIRGMGPFHMEFPSAYTDSLWVLWIAPIA